MKENIVELNNIFAYIKNKPIMEASQMPVKLEWNKIDDEWNDRIKDNFWHIEYRGNIRDQKMIELLELRDKLLTFGGDQALIPPVEEDLKNILDRGQLFYGDRIKMKKGLPSQCHYNSCKCWDVNKDKVRIATGYALTVDGLWRQHSWLVFLRPRKNMIVETTVKRIAYFGFVMTEEECEEFYYNCV